MKKEKNKAEFEACWAGNFVYMCERHLRCLRTIGAAIGEPVNYKPYDGSNKCKNCENGLDKKLG